MVLQHGLDYLSFNTIHVAGTNGKGSVSHMLVSILQTSGYKVGLFTSPHLFDYKERITANKDINFNLYIQHLENYELENNITLGYFESTFLIAAKAFLHNDFDYFIS